MSHRLHWMLYRILITITYFMQRAGAENGHATEGENRCKRLLSALRSVQSFACDTTIKVRKALMVPAIKAQKLVAILSRCCPDKRHTFGKQQSICETIASYESATSWRYPNAYKVQYVKTYMSEPCSAIPTLRYQDSSKDM